MLKTIRNRIVGMMKTLRIVMSLQPRVAAREAGLSVVITAVAKASFLHALEKEKEGAASPLRRQVELLAAAVFLERRVPIGSQRIERFLGRAGIAGHVRIDALVELLQQFGIFRNRPEILHLEHGLVEGLVIRRGVLEL